MSSTSSALLETYAASAGVGSPSYPHPPATSHTVMVQLYHSTSTVSRSSFFPAKSFSRGASSPILTLQLFYRLSSGHPANQPRRNEGIPVRLSPLGSPRVPVSFDTEEDFLTHTGLVRPEFLPADLHPSFIPARTTQIRWSFTSSSQDR